MSYNGGLFQWLLNSTGVNELANIAVDFDGSGQTGHKETLGAFAKNLFRKWSGSGLTDSQIQMNQFNAQQSQIARDFEERMSSTANQRAVADMQAAGLNPALMYGSGSAASTPSGSAASAASDSSGTLGFGEIVNALMLPAQLAQANAQIRNTNAQTSNVQANTEATELENAFNRDTYNTRIKSLELSNSLTDEQRRQIEDNRGLIAENIKKTIAETTNEEARNDLILWQTSLNRASAEQIAALLPYQRLLLSAQTDSQKATAALSLMQAAYQSKLIDSGFIEQQISSMQKQARAALASAAAANRSAKAAESSAAAAHRQANSAYINAQAHLKTADAQAALAGVNAELQAFKNQIYRGEFFDENSGAIISDTTAKFLNGFTSAVSGLATAIGGPLSSLVN